ncbi:hypothetical protein OWV82_015993 [Melia azedarach]|uniref:Uncharacterized protein n=2 Tax=Melia azedarach TaxID=155640 RepID=A0ACC1XRD9_MELAZ|nr:hypothetical protein OWV82_015785 [Melia azedarach]KAJ4713969.1 hypothetical protein OWV82_015993 [Melia azedarach]
MHCPSSTFVILLDHQTATMSLRNPRSDHYQDYNRIHNSTDAIKSNPHDSFLHQEEENDNDNGEIFGVILSRRISSEKFHGLLRCDDNAVRRTVSMRAGEKQGSSFAHESAVRRAFSMRAMPAVSQAYCRMDYQYDSVSDEENLLTPQAHAQANNNGKKRNKIFKACKRLFCLKI